MATKKYINLNNLSTFLTVLRETFAEIGHKHSISDVTDYVVDTALSSTSVNPVQNKIIDAEFEAVSNAMGALENAIDSKSDSTHTHDDRYYTESEIDSKLSAKSDSTHTHDDRYYTESEIDGLFESYEFITVADIDNICGQTIQYASINEVMF